jgi:RNA 2',3'-cyclic 3'-phosphodiesterase
MSRGATARLFVAVDLPVQACEQLLEWARVVADSARAAGGSRGSLRLLDVQSLHLTLCFLGNRPVGELQALVTALTPCAEHACECSVGAPLWLPPRRPHALAVEIHDRDGELQRVQERVSGALSRVSGWCPERRRFRPHITLARLRGRTGRRRWTTGLADGASDRSRSQRSRWERPERALPLPATPRLSFTPEALVLYRSWLTPEGSSYEALASSELAAVGR